MRYTLTADSGSTKTDWVVACGKDRVKAIKTQGINPSILSEERIQNILQEELLPQLECLEISSVRFYGAGCRGEQCELVAGCLQRLLHVDDVFVGSDMLGAAKIMCAHEEGIVCILGTGSNSCLFDGNDIVANVSPLGFILGDEGSGAVLGRRLVGDILKKQMPKEICDDFSQTYHLSVDNIIKAVYKEACPNRFLAGFAPFLYKHKDNEAIRLLITDEFTRFFQRNVCSYGRKDVPVHFVGSIAYYFQEELKEVAERLGFLFGKVKKSPLGEF